ncbi:hypothetical protein [Mesorhizobium sp. M0146]|uniref:hypothetical protein n=1 Tax=unclassified Mesorhizobium TaxID=325217 RepID=UPI003336DAD7
MTAADAEKLLGSGKKEKPDQGGRAKSKSDQITDKLKGVAREEIPVAGVPAVWPEDLRGRRKVKTDWFKAAARKLSGRALKGACILDEQFMVKSLSMHRTDKFLADEFEIDKRTLQRAFEDLKAAGFTKFKPIYETVDGKIRLVERVVTLCFPTDSPQKVDTPEATTSVGAVTNLGEQRQTWGGSDKTEGATADVVASSTLDSETCENETPEKRQLKKEKEVPPSGGLPNFDFEEPSSPSVPVPDDFDTYRLESLIDSYPFHESKIRRLIDDKGWDRARAVNALVKLWIKDHWFPEFADFDEEYKEFPASEKAFIKKCLLDRVEDDWWSY